MPRVVKTSRVLRTRVAKTARVAKTRRVPDNLFGDVLRAAAYRPVFTADLYVIDGGSGKVRAVVDHQDVAHWLDQADTTKQCALPAGHADFGGALCLTASGTQYYVSNRPNNFFHDGTGFRSFFVYTPTNTTGLNALFATHRRQDSNVQNGIWVADNVSASVQRYQCQVANSTAFRVIDTGPTAASGFSISVATYADVKYKESDSPEFFLKAKSAACLSGNSAAAPSAGNAGAALTLFANGSTFDDKASMRWRSFANFPVLGAQDESIVRAWITADTGIAA